MSNQRGIIHLFPLVLLLAGLVIGIYLVNERTNFLPQAAKLVKNRFKLPGSAGKPTVEVKTTYKNPFKKENQYVNPFDEFKSPFLNVK